MRNLQMALYIICLIHMGISVAFLCFGIILCMWFGRAPVVSADVFNSIDGVAIGSLFMSAFSGVVAFEGYIATSKAYNGLLWFFAFSSLMLTGLYLTFGIYPLVQPEVTAQMVVSLWNSIGSKGRAIVQDWFSCCGLTGPDNRVANSGRCPVTITPAFGTISTMPGCLPVILDYLGEDNRNWSIVMFSFATISFLGLVIVLRFRYVLRKRIQQCFVQQQVKNQMYVQQPKDYQHFLDMDSIVIDDGAPPKAHTKNAMNRYMIFTLHTSHRFLLRKVTTRPLFIKGLPGLITSQFPRRAYCEQKVFGGEQSISERFKADFKPSPFNQTIDKQKSTTSSTLNALWKVVQTDWVLLVGVTITSIATAAVNVYTPRIIGSIANILAAALKSGTSISAVLVEIRQPAMILCSLFASNGILTFVYISLVTALGESVAQRLRMSLFENLIKQDIAFFDIKRAGELVSALSNDISEFKHSFKICVSQGIKSVTQIAGYLVQLMQISWTMTGYLLLATPILYGLGSLYGSYLRHLSKLAKEAEGSLSAIATEAFTNIRTVKAFANEEYEMRKFGDAVEMASMKQKSLGYNIGVFQGFTNFGIGGMIVYVLYLGGNLVASGQMTGGDLMSYLISIQNAQKSLASITVLVAQSAKAISAFNRVTEYLNETPRIPTSSGIELDVLDGTIEFSNVHFAYPSRPDHVVFDDFNLEIPAGKVYALCGSSGAGKSTVGALIERFYDPAGGVIKIDGRDIRELDPKWLRNNIGYIHQEPILFAGTILDNIKYAKPSASMEEIKIAAQAANAADFIDSLPDKYETIVGERGVTLSGGQRQRIAIARALLKNPKILIFDEATSALDATSERIVQEALTRLMHGRTVILIAHRLSTIQDAHQIILLGKGGRILEMGTHEELMNKRGGYYNLYSTLHE